jgi:hypothetical protein
MSSSEYQTQLLIYVANNFANQERYLLQPSTPVSLESKNTKEVSERCFNFELGDELLGNVNSSQHLGITRTPTVAENAEVNVSNNLAKARRTLYSLFGAGLHGENGLDPLTTIHLYRTYVLPILLYGLELLLPFRKLIDKHELFQKKTLKINMSLPNSTADPSAYTFCMGCFQYRPYLKLECYVFSTTYVIKVKKALKREFLYDN